MTTASEVFATSQSSKCIGDVECHWCSAPCGRLLFCTDDPPPLFGTRRTSTAKRPANPFLCTGCYLWKRKRVTVNYLAGGYLDGRCALDHSWYIDDANAFAIHIPYTDMQIEMYRKDCDALYQFLLKPPLRFVLSLITDAKTKNQIHLAIANDLVEIKGDTPLFFTINNIPHSYNIYELEEAIKHGAPGKEPGVAALFKLLGKPEKPEEEEVKRGRGRPKKDFENPLGTLTKTINRSGQLQPA